MKKYILSFLLLCGALTMTMGQIVYETFEEGDTLPWNGSFGDGSFMVVDNPADSDPLGINASAKVGSYAKEAGKPFSLLIAVLENTMDLSTNNQFKIQVNSPVRTDMIFKLEGDGEAIEQKKTYCSN